MDGVDKVAPFMSADGDREGTDSYTISVRKLGPRGSIVDSFSSFHPAGQDIFETIDIDDSDNETLCTESPLEKDAGIAHCTEK